MNSKIAIHAALTGVLSLGLLGSQALAADSSAGAEKCYGVVKSGKNDCQTNAHACAGQATMDSQGDSWVYLPKGTCDKIVGGSTSPKA